MAKNHIQLDSIAAEIHNVTIQELMHSDYLPYAFYTIRDRALVAESGLKPVQERILLSLWNMGGKHTSKTIKAGTVYSHTMGNYHPHSDASIADAGAKFGQTFSSRVPLIIVQGQVGFEFGDSPASVRYYEIKLSKAGQILVEDIDSKSIEFTRNFSDTEDVPVQLPVQWPVSLINGGEGISVGYSSYLPPHNPTEVMNAVIKRMQGKITDVKSLMKVMKGPDMPTGGILLGTDGVKDYFSTGKGRFLIRGQYTIEKITSGRHKIKFYELPFKVAPEKILKEISTAKEKGRLKDISEAKNLSGATRGTEFSIVVKAGANPETVVEDIFKFTSLESAYNVSNTVLLDKKPYIASVLEIIDSFIAFRREIFINKSVNRLEYLKKEKVRLEGLVKVLVDVEAATAIILKSETELTAKEKLMTKFKINEEQALYILNLKLRSLTKADRNDLILKADAVNQEIEQLEAILANEELLINAIVEEFEGIKKIIQDDRRTIITGITSEELQQQQKEQAKQERLLAKDVDCYIYVLANNTVVKLLEEETQLVPVRYSLKTTSKADIGVVLSDGTLKTVNVENIPLYHPTSIDMLFGTKGNLAGLIPMELTEETYKGILFVTNNGGVNILKGKVKDPLVKITDEKLILVKPLTLSDYENDLFIIAEDGMLAKFPVNTISERNSGAGFIAGMKYKLPCVSADLGDSLSHVLTKSKNTIKITESDIIPATSRGVKGAMLHKLKKDDVIVDMFISHDIRAYTLDTQDYTLPEATDRAKGGTKETEDLFIGV